ncbi:hypothetical protein BC831DRAFT_481349 [Entophlyctis helioformis]|nr:hypothetical protein BC831DRAFT_481349 [Entophlyctis helioformis]
MPQTPSKWTLALVQTLADGAWHSLPRTAVATNHAHRFTLAAQTPAQPVPGIVQVDNPLQMPALGSLMLALDWPALSSPAAIAGRLLSASPLSPLALADLPPDAPQHVRVAAESLLLLGLFLLLCGHSQTDSRLEPSTRDQLLRGLADGAADLSASVLPPGTWTSVFSTRSLRLRSTTATATSWTSAINDTLDRVRLQWYTSQGFFELGHMSATDAARTKRLTAAISASYFTAYEKRGTDTGRDSLRLLAVYARQLPASWLRGPVVKMLCDDGGRDALTLLLARARVCDPDEMDGLVVDTLAKQVHSGGDVENAGIATAALLVIASKQQQQQLVQLDSPLYTAIRSGLAISPRSDALFDALAAIAASPLIDPLCQTLLGRVDETWTFHQHVQVMQLFGRISHARATAFDAALPAKTGVGLLGCLGFSGKRPPPAWIAETVTRTAGVDVVNGLEDTRLNHVQLFALLGILQVFVQRKKEGKPVPATWMRSLSRSIAASMSPALESPEQTAFVFANVMKAVTEAEAPGVIALMSDVTGVALATLDTLLEHPDGLAVPEYILGPSVEMATCAETLAYFSDAAVERSRSPVGSSLGYTSVAVARSIEYLWTRGEVSAVEAICARMRDFARRLHEQWTACPLSSSTPTTETQKRTLEGITRHFKLVLMGFIFVFEGLFRSALDDLEAPRLAAKSDTTAAATLVALEAFSFIHFVTAGFGLDGIESWKRLFGLFCAAQSRNGADGVEHAIRTLVPPQPPAGPEYIETHPVGKSRALFFLLLSSKLLRVMDTKTLETIVLPFAQPYLRLARPLPVAPGWKPDADDLDLFDVAHSLHLKIFETSARFRDIVCGLAPSYVQTLLAIFPELMDIEMLRISFGAVMRGFGQTFFTGPGESFAAGAHSRSRGAALSASEDTVDDGSESDRAAELEARADKVIADGECDGDSTIGWQGLEDQAQELAMTCLGSLVDAIDALGEISTPSSMPAAASDTNGPPADRIGQIVHASPAMGNLLLHNQLLLVLFDQLATIPLPYLSDLMAEITDRMLGNSDRGLEGAGLAATDSPLWVSLFEVVSEDSRVDYSRRAAMVEWYLDLHSDAKQLMAERRRGLTSVPLQQSDAPPPAIRAKL